MLVISLNHGSSYTGEKFTFPSRIGESSDFENVCCVSLVPKCLLGTVIRNLIGEGKTI